VTLAGAPGTITHNHKAGSPVEGPPFAYLTRQFRWSNQQAMASGVTMSVQECEAMSISIKWEDIYVTGIRDIDEQHRHFVDLINRMSACTDADIRSEAGRKLVVEILNYAGMHFAMEEGLMVTHRYPDRDAHAREHRTLEATLANKAVALASGAEPRSSAVMFLWNWLVAHTNLEDKSLSKHLFKHGVK